MNQTVSPQTIGASELAFSLALGAVTAIGAAAIILWPRKKSRRRRRRRLK